MKNSVLIIGAGEDKISLNKIKNFNNIICADGGYDYIRNRIKPIAIIGDLDSIQNIKITENIKIIKYPKNKDKTDTELAILYAIKHNFDNIYLTGVNGTRTDQFYTIIKLLEKYKKYNIRVITEKFEIFLLKPETLYSFENMKNKLISLFSLTLKSVDFNNKGLEYSFNELYENNPIGVSNRIVDKRCEIYFEKGLLLCFIEI